VEKAGRITVRLFGEHRHAAGDLLRVTPAPDRIHRFDAKGNVMR
jgi:multiple sugar transport system ATP-binding protein